MADNTQILYNMGGFHLFERGSEETINDNRRISPEDKEPIHPLQAIDLVDVYESFTMPTKVEIQASGKSDQLFIQLQTSWFVLQCIAHAIGHLPVNHLEIVTLAYAAMNSVIYMFRRNKPLNVNRPVRVSRKSEPPLEMQPGLENRSQSAEIDLGGDQQWLRNDIDVDREEDVDLSCDECRYNCSPLLISFLGIWLADMGFNITVLFSPFIWRYTVYFSSGGHLCFSVYVS